MDETAPPGWHPDGQGNERYWDGAAWTDQVRLLSATSKPKKVGALSKLGDAVKSAATEKLGERGERVRRQAEDALAAGALVTSGVFGTATVEIYENGYVRVAEWGERTSGTGPKATDKNTPYEKLISITFTQATEQASGATSALENTVGPAVAKLMKGGKGLLKASAPGMAVAGVAHLSSNAARKTFLTIATDKQIHTLTNQGSKTLGVKLTNKGHDDVGRALEIAGNAALGVVAVDPQPAGAPAIAADPPPPPASQPPAVPTLKERMRELADLHKEGILSDQEFADAKAKLLDGL
jgi:hypothetical protein